MTNKVYCTAREMFMSQQQDTSTRLRPNAKTSGKFLRLCQLVDSMMEEFEGDRAEINLDPIESESTVSVVASDFIFQGGRSHPFFVEGQCADNIRFKPVDNNTKMEIEFVVYDMWVRS